MSLQISFNKIIAEACQDQDLGGDVFGSDDTALLIRGLAGKALVREIQPDSLRADEQIKELNAYIAGQRMEVFEPMTIIPDEVVNKGGEAEREGKERQRRKFYESQMHLRLERALSKQLETTREGKTVPNFGPIIAEVWKELQVPKEQEQLLRDLYDQLVDDMMTAIIAKIVENVEIVIVALRLEETVNAQVRKMAQALGMQTRDLRFQREAILYSVVADEVGYPRDGIDNIAKDPLDPKLLVIQRDALDPTKMLSDGKTSEVAYFDWLTGERADQELDEEMMLLTARPDVAEMLRRWRGQEPLLDEEEVQRLRRYFEQNS